jgi:hypothetical protein
MKFAALLLTLTVFAQDLPEIRGTVTEYASPNPVSGAVVTLYEFVAPEGTVVRQLVATAYSNDQGAFSIKPAHAGRYYIEASKPLYLSAEEIEKLGWISGRAMMEMPLDVPEESANPVRFMLVRPGGLTGRVIDENDKPVPNFNVVAMGLGPHARSDRAVTDKDGVFTLPAIIPTPRLVRVGPSSNLMFPARSSFTKTDLERVDEDIETAYWPGGVADPALALPLALIPGAVVNIGTIRLRKVPYYRALLTYSGDCTPREGWMLMLDAGLRPSQCAKVVLLDKLLPGQHTLGVVIARSDSAPGRWALEPFSIDRANAEVPIHFNPSAEVPVRISGANAAALGASKVALRSTSLAGLDSASLWMKPMAPNFAFDGVLWPRHEVYFPQLDSNQPVRDGTITLAAGASLEIVIDEQPASLSGTAPARSTVYVARWPFVPIIERPYVFTFQADASGKFEIPALTAGDYRAISTPSTLDAQTLARLLETAARVTLDRGGQKTIDLK